MKKFIAGAVAVAALLVTAPAVQADEYQIGGYVLSVSGSLYDIEDSYGTGSYGTGSYGTGSYGTGSYDTDSYGTGSYGTGSYGTG